MIVYIKTISHRSSNVRDVHYVRSVRIRSFSDPYFLAFGLNRRDATYTDQRNSKYRHFLRSGIDYFTKHLWYNYLLKQFHQKTAEIGVLAIYKISYLTKSGIHRSLERQKVTEKECFQSWWGISRQNQYLKWQETSKFI